MHHTAELRDAKCEKRRRERAYRASGLEVHKQIYREQCRRYNAMFDQCKSKYYQSKIETADQRKLFHMIDGMFTVKPFPLFPSHISVQELTERFGAHFTNKIFNLRQNMVSCTATNYTSSISALKCSLGEFNEVTPETVHELIKKSPLKSCPLDAIPTGTLSCICVRNN